jgi:hypothetical protein
MSTEVEATAEVFWTAFKVLTRAEQQAVLRRLLQNQTLRHDLIDLALIEEHREEPARPLREYIQETRK